MRHYFIVVILLLCNFHSVDAEVDAIEQKWVAQDSIFITQAIKAYKANPTSLESLLMFKNHKRKKLGFGYDEVSGGTGKGYVSIFFTSIYFNGKLVSYKVSPQMPRDNRLTNRYKRFYAPLFSFSGSSPEPIYYNFAQMTKPLPPESDTNLKDGELAYYMTPYSGTIYGDKGGWGTVLDNWACYKFLKSKITPKVCEVLMYSINPATRLTAIEYYYQHSKLFGVNKQKIEKRVQEVFNELPQVTTMAADEEIVQSAKELVSYFANKR